MKKFLFLFIFCCMFLNINAQEYEGIIKGDKEITFNGMVISASGYTIGNLFLSYGHYFSDKLVLGIAPGITISEDMTEISGQLYGNYNFSSSKPSFPYIKASYYQSSFDTEDVDFFDLGFIQAGIGYKSFFNDKVSWDTSVTYGLSTASFDSGMLMLMTGISIKW